MPIHFELICVWFLSKNTTEILIESVLNLLIALDYMDILTTLMLPIHGHELSFHLFVFLISLWSSCGIYARSQLICSESTLVDVIHNSLGYAADDINRHLWWVPSREFCNWRDWNRLLISLNIRRFVHSHSGSICLFYIWSVHSFCVICCLQKQKGELFQRHLNKRVRNHFKAKFNLKCVRSAHLQKRPRQTFVKK